jgi:hypothetical protein
MLQSAGRPDWRRLRGNPDQAMCPLSACSLLPTLVCVRRLAWRPATSRHTCALSGKDSILGKMYGRRLRDRRPVSCRGQGQAVASVSRRWQVISTLAAWVVTWFGLVFVQGMPSSTSGRFGYVGGSLLSCQTRLRLLPPERTLSPGSRSVPPSAFAAVTPSGAAGAAVPYVARCRTRFLSPEHIQQRDT